MAKFGAAEHSIRASVRYCFAPKDAEEIIHNSVKYTPIDDNYCIYVLLSRGVVVYVGQTSNLPLRLTQHAKNKAFDAYWSTPVPRDELSSAEAAYIVALNPRLNTALPPNMEYMTHAAAVALIGGGWAMKRAIRSGAVTAIHLHLGPVYRSDEVVNVISGGAA